MTANKSDQSLFVARLNPISGAVALAVGSMTLGTSAQAAPAGYYDEEMIVTSTRREANVQDVPFNMAAFSGELVQKQRLANLNEFARWVPGLTLTNQGQRSANILTVRGINASSVDSSEGLGNSGGDTVSTYVGEIPVYVDLKPYDMERIEVLIGPQGTLYGAGTLAGAVRYIPMAPNLDDLSLDTHVKTYLQNESSDVGYGGDLTVNVPIVRDVLGFRSTLAYVHEAGFIDYNNLVQRIGVSNPEPDLTDPAAVAGNLASRDDVDDENTLNWRATLRWDISDSVSTSFRYDFQNKQVGGRTAVHTQSFDTVELVSGHRVLEPNERENHIIEYLIEADFGFAELTSATGYTKFREDGNRDQTDLLLNFEYGYEDFPSFTAWTRDRENQDILTQEVRLVSNHDGPVNWIAGGFYSNTHQDAISSEFTPGIPRFFGIAPPPLPTRNLEFLQLTRDQLREWALFGEIGWQIVDRWQVTGGARLYDYRTDTSISVDLPLIGVVDSPYDRAKSDDDGVILKFNTSLTLDDWIPGMSAGTAYLTVSEGYRVGGSNLFAPCISNPPPPGQNVCLIASEQSFQPDETLNYELGLKSTWFDDALLVNLTGFYIDWTDVQLDTISLFGDVPITTNASDAESMGTELQLRWNITDWLSVFGSYAYTDVELSQDAPSIIGVRNALPEDAFKGDRLPATPKNQGSFNVNVSRPIAGDMTIDVDYGFVSMSNVYTKTGLRGRGEALPGFTVHHLSAAVSADEWTLTLFVDNLFDKYAVTGARRDQDYIDKRADGDGLGTNQFTLRQYFYNVIRPRTIGLDLIYKFDL